MSLMLTPVGQDGAAGTEAQGVSRVLRALMPQCSSSRLPATWRQSDEERPGTAVGSQDAFLGWAGQGAKRSTGVEAVLWNQACVLCGLEDQSLWKGRGHCKS